MSTPSRPGRTGAVRDEPRRKKGLLWALLGLLALLLLALLLYLLLRGNDKKPAAAVVPGPATTTATTGALETTQAPVPSDTPLPSDTPVPSDAPVPPTDSTTAVPPTPPPTPGAPSAVPPAGAPGGLVGGGTVAPVPATGALARADAVGTVLFAESSAQLTDQARAVISDAAARIKATKPSAVTVTGYTDKIAGQPINERLSQQRADAVVAALKADVGSGTSTYTASAKGESDPVASNDTATGRQQNRRATITVG